MLSLHIVKITTKWCDIFTKWASYWGLGLHLFHNSPLEMAEHVSVLLEHHLVGGARLGTRQQPVAGEQRGLGLRGELDFYFVRN